MSGVLLGLRAERDHLHAGRSDRAPRLMLRCDRPALAPGRSLAVLAPYGRLRSRSRWREVAEGHALVLVHGHAPSASFDASSGIPMPTWSSRSRVVSAASTGVPSARQRSLA